MQIKTDGLIIQERSISENDRLVTILTKELGVITAFVKGAKNIKNKNFSGTQLFCYSDLLIYKGRNTYIINEANRKSYFWSLTSNIERLSLAQYFCELVGTTVHEELSHDILRLILNSLYYLSNNIYKKELIKVVFELRLLSMLGFMPNLVSCKICKVYNSKKMYFSPQLGSLLCEKCYCKHKKSGYVDVSPAMITCMRYIIYSDLKKAFSFELKENLIKKLNYISETYVSTHVDKKLKTLDFYKQVILNL